MSDTALVDAPDVHADGEWAVETHGLTKRFGSNVAVDGVDLRVPRGSAFGYLGPNGAGKTTLIRVLLGLTHADAGTMSLLGFRVPRRSRRCTGESRSYRRRAPVPRPPDRQGEPRASGGGEGTCGSRPHRAVTRARRDARPRKRPGVQVLDGHASEVGGGGLPTRRPSTAHSGRAHERAGPGGYARNA